MSDRRRVVFSVFADIPKHFDAKMMADFLRRTIQVGLDKVEDTLDIDGVSSDRNFHLASVEIAETDWEHVCCEAARNIMAEIHDACAEQYQKGLDDNVAYVEDIDPYVLVHEYFDSSPINIEDAIQMLQTDFAKKYATIEEHWRTDDDPLEAVVTKAQDIREHAVSSLVAACYKAFRDDIYITDTKETFETSWNQAVENMEDYLK